MNNGLLVVNKPKGMTSRDVVNKVCRKFNTKSVGHIGTLDPLAEGVLVCLIGKYTKLANILTNHDKEYIASFKLGILTDTLDITGKVLKECKKEFSKDEITSALNHFKGKYNQEVPIYSAVKVNGKKLYEYARNNIDVKLPSKIVNIYDIEFIDIKDDIITIKCRVSKGTYIRSLIRDIGAFLDTYATMTSLVRTTLGNFNIDEAYTLEDIENNNYKLLKLTDFLDVVTKKIDNEEDYKHIKNGNVMNINTNNYILFTYEDEDIALYEPFDNKIKPLIMF